ncbi:hypothetical protein A3765_01195 [Oleiphilus sp. HI0130]|nr:hypothetical protein A3765_01195 [Oleiphilus sp. HI0130]
MAGTSLFALIDDIATVLDDIALMTKVAAKKTAGVLGDDLALNAQQVSGVKADRELPVVWAVAKGSFKNKLILVPTALALSALVPQLITPLLIIGGLYLCFEGFEKIWHHLMHTSDQQAKKEQLREALTDPTINMADFERDKIKGAIRTDFILSAEIIVIALGTVASETFAKQASVVCLIAIAMTIGVYGLVAAIVKLDDAGLYLKSNLKNTVISRAKRAFGNAILWFCPWLMKSLSLFGTLAMFLVGGGIIAHGLPFVHHLSEHIISFIGYPTLSGLVLNLFVGLLSGAACLLALNRVKSCKKSLVSASH